MLDAVAAPHAADLGSHLVQFYEDDGFIVEEVAEFLDGALRSGDAAILIATPDHRAALMRRLQSFGGAGSRQPWYPGELISLDARETLALFMVGDRPEEALFQATVGSVVARAAQGGARAVRAFGEMVALLYADGKPEAALQLEELWNGLAKHHTFSLLCAYPINLFASSDHAEAFRHVCAAHTRVRPAESFGSPADSPELAEKVAALQQKAIALQTEVARRVAAEQTLRRREKELSDFFENAAEGLHRVGADGTILWANKAELDMLGYAPEEYIGHHIAEFYVDKQLIGRILQRLGAGETLSNQPATLRCKNGGRKYVQITSNAYFENDQLVYTRCFTRDVSDRWLREQAEHERNNLLMRAPVAAALLTGHDHVFRLANPLYCQMVGRADLVGRSFREAFPELAGAELPKVLDRVFETGEPFVANEHCIWLDKQGNGVLEECFFKLNLEPLRTPDGSVYGMMAVAIDISEIVHGRRVLEQSHAERSKLLDELQAASRAKDEFLAMLGHELRNPLSPIVTALQLMKMRGDLQSTKEQAIIQRQVDHLIRLVDDLLDVSRITRGKVELRTESVEIAQVLARSVEMASLLFEQRRHRLTIDVPSTGLLWIGDPTRLAQVVSNLLTNAARYTEPGGLVSLRAFRAGDEITISVADNGKGLAPDLLPRVFQLFFQGHQGVDRAEGGLGIGLALVKNLVELHGGTVEAKSDGPGHGSEFVVRLPARRTPASDNVVAAVQGAAPSGSEGRRIVIVDDNADAAEMLGMLLRANGHSVLIAHDPMEALSVAETYEPQIALLDIGLPLMDGYELASQLRVRIPACRLIAVSGYGQDADRKRSEAAGFNGHLVKPVDAGLLLDALSRLSGTSA
ncbi:ATP-binding protein [Schlegelella sp. S2-27]|uniref:histidine kinase n=1 Tax=Caldimonas mangrovi TaxID=2944811 RepID=A0ABT0YWG5_9BURK|nr:ATP-binding protein [Caldimonas mangrovi]MCM5682948.1 ATP-binding protein [Caldimonas mangrovi]